MYENTGTQAHLMAADLIEAGVDVHDIYRHVYEGVPYGKLALLARGLANVQRYDDGRLTITDLSVGDFSDSDAEESYSEGVIDHLRAVAGHPPGRAGARPPRRPGNGGAARSRCAPATTPSTCRRSPAPRAAAAIARRPASAPSCPTTSWCRSCASSSPRRAELVTRPAGAVSAVGGDRDHILLYDKPAGVTSHDVVAAVRRTLPRKTKVGHAGTLDPFATGLLLVLVGRATRAQRFFMALPKRYEVVARFGAVSTTGDPEGEITETGNVPAGELALPDRARSASARPRTRRSRWAGAGPTSWRGPGSRSRAGRARGHGAPLRAALA